MGGTGKKLYGLYPPLVWPKLIPVPATTWTRSTWPYEIYKRPRLGPYFNKYLLRGRGTLHVTANFPRLLHLLPSKKSGIAGILHLPTQFFSLFLHFHSFFRHPPDVSSNLLIKTSDVILNGGIFAYIQRFLLGWYKPISFVSMLILPINLVLFSSGRCIICRWKQFSYTSTIHLIISFLDSTSKRRDSHPSIIPLNPNSFNHAQSLPC